MNMQLETIQRTIYKHIDWILLPAPAPHILSKLRKII